MGGIPVPSMAVIRTDRSAFDNFGEITLIAKPSLIDPQRDKTSKVFNADVYSPRYPSVKIEMQPSATKKLAAFLEGMEAGDGYGESINGLVSEIKDSGFEKTLRGSSRFAQKFLKENGIDTTQKEGEESYAYGARLRKEARDFGKGDEYNQWIASLPEREGWETKERIFDGFTNSGNRKYLKHDLDTVVKILKRKLQDGEGFNYGVPSIRTGVAKKFRSIEAIQKSRNDIITKSEMDKVKEEVDAEFVKLAEEIAPDRSLDSFSDDMKAAAEGGSENWRHLREMYNGEVPYGRMRAFLDKIKNLPTEYFEAKVQRAVALHEFDAAAIPDNTPQELRDALKKRGIDAREYPKSDAEARKKIVADLAREHAAALLPESPANGKPTSPREKAAQRQRERQSITVTDAKQPKSRSPAPRQRAFAVKIAAKDRMDRRRELQPN